MTSPRITPGATNPTTSRDASLPPDLERGRDRDLNPTPLRPRAKSLDPDHLQRGGTTYRIPFSELVGPEKAQELDDRWGALHGPRLLNGVPMVYDHERNLVNPGRVIIPADKAASFDLQATLDIEALKAGQTFVWAMGKTALHVAPEAVVGVSERSGEPRTLGHPTLLSIPEEARAAGELKWNGSEFCINLRSGRYSRGREDLGPAQVQEVARLFHAAGLPVTVLPGVAAAAPGSLEDLAGRVPSANAALQLLGSPQLPGTILALPADKQQWPLLAMWRRMLQPAGEVHRPMIQAALCHVIEQLPPDLRSRLFIGMARQGGLEVDPCLSPAGTPGSILNLPPEHLVPTLKAVVESSIGMRAAEKESALLIIKEVAASLPPELGHELQAAATAGLYHHRADPSVGDGGRRPFHHEQLGARRGVSAANTFAGGLNPVDRRTYDRAVRDGGAWLTFTGMTPEDARSPEGRMARVSLVLMDHFDKPVRLLRIKPTDAQATERQVAAAFSVHRAQANGQAGELRVIADIEKQVQEGCALLRQTPPDRLSDTLDALVEDGVSAAKQRMQVVRPAPADVETAIADALADSLSDTPDKTESLCATVRAIYRQQADAIIGRRQLIEVLSDPNHGRERGALMFETKEDGFPLPVTLRWDRQDGQCSLVSSARSDQPVLRSTNALAGAVDAEAGFVCIVPDNPVDPLVEMANHGGHLVEDAGARFGIGRVAAWGHLSQELAQRLRQFEAAAADAAPKKVLGLSMPTLVSAQKKEALDKATQGLQLFCDMLAYAARRPAMVGSSAESRIDGMLRALADVESRLANPGAKVRLQEVRDWVTSIKTRLHTPL